MIYGDSHDLHRFTMNSPWLVAIHNDSLRFACIHIDSQRIHRDLRDLPIDKGLTAIRNDSTD